MRRPTEDRTERQARARPKPNRGRWCKGKPGVEHNWHWVPDEELMQRYRTLGGKYALPENMVLSKLICTDCGKHPSWGRRFDSSTRYIVQHKTLLRFFGPAFGAWKAAFEK